LSGISDESYRSKPEPDAPQIVITGNVSLGAAEINYV
jgi:hypothetical protein